MSWSVLAILAGCTGGATEAPVPAPTDAPPPVGDEPRDTLVIGVLADIGNLVPVVSDGAFDATILDLLSYPLFESSFDCSLKKSPGVAKSWDWRDDGKVLSMELRDDLKWEDGAPVTVEDLVFTYELVGDPTVASPRLSHVERMTADGRPKVIDPTHIEWHFTAPYDRDTQMAHAGLPLVPKHLFGTADRATLRGHERARSPLSYGPWRIAKWEPNQQLVLEPNPNFTGPEEHRPHLKRVIFQVIPDPGTRLLELEAGKIDMMENLLVSDADRLRESHPNLRMVRRGWRSQDSIIWNLSNPLFADVKVRKALAMATDVDAMIGHVLTSAVTHEAYARRSIGTVTPALCGVHNDDVVPIPFQLEAARALLAEAGWRDTDNDGWLDKDGKPFSFTLTTNTGNKRRGDTSLAFQDQMKKVGVEVKLQPVETNTMFERGRKRDFEALLSGWSAGLFVDPGVIWKCDDPANNKRAELNFGGYCNEEVDDLIDQGLTTANAREAAPIWKSVQAKIYEDQPYLFLWWMDEIDAIDARFENTTIDVLSPYNNLHDWEVPADKVKYKN
ncbi:MAG: ABC transporter substrate-binding protein [Myxococcota bacterium]